MAHRLNQLEHSRLLRSLPRILAAGACTLMISAASAQSTVTRSLITSKQVIAAMQDKHLPTQGIAVRLPADITTSTISPSLEIQTVIPINSTDIRLRIVCRDHSACLPFFAVASYASEIGPAIFLAEATHKPGGLALLPTAITAATQASGTPAAIVKSGSPATLDFDEDRVHVRVDVICLQSGAPGDHIRVTTRDRKQVYVAEIVSPGTLKGTLTR